MAVGQDEVLRPGSGFETYSDVGHLVVAAGEAAQKVDAESAAVSVRLHRDGVGSGGALGLNALHLLQQEVHGEHVVLYTAGRAGPDDGDALQVVSV